MGKNLRLLNKYLKRPDILSSAEGVNKAAIVTTDSVYVGMKHLNVKTGIFTENLKIYPIDQVISVNLSKRLFVYKFELETKRGISKESTIFFYRSVLADFTALTDRIEDLRIKLLAPTVGGIISVTQQIKELAELREKGILTEREFNNKKSDLLRRIA